MQEVILTKNQIRELIVSLPQVGPFGAESIKNSDSSVLVNKVITANGPSLLAELHEKYHDVFLVMAGEAKVMIGGEIKDKQKISPGEWQGKNLVSAKEYQVRAGDIVIIPKGIAHQHGAGSIKMLVIKLT